MSPQVSRRKTDPAKPALEACPECQGSGYRVTAEGTLEPCPCGALDELKAADRLRRARIPDRYINKSLDTFIARDPIRREILSAARHYVDGFHLREVIPGLLLRGGTGAGKTHVACGILRDILRNGYTGIYCNVTELLARLRSTYEDRAEEAESEVLEEYTGCDLLVLDDLGSESTTPWVLDRLYYLINRRYESFRPIVVTTNCDEKELQEKVGLRIASRLYEMCCRKFPDFPREDYRMKMLANQG